MAHPGPTTIIQTVDVVDLFEKFNHTKYHVDGIPIDAWPVNIYIEKYISFRLHSNPFVCVFFLKYKCVLIGRHLVSDQDDFNLVVEVLDEIYNMVGSDHCCRPKMGPQKRKLERGKLSGSKKRSPTRLATLCIAQDVDFPSHLLFLNRYIDL